MVSGVGGGGEESARAVVESNQSLSSVPGHYVGIAVAGDEVHPAITIEVGALVWAGPIATVADNGHGAEIAAAIVLEDTQIVAEFVDRGDVG